MVNGSVNEKEASKFPTLIGGLENDFYDFPYGNVIIPTDELIFFRGVGQPPTR